MVNNYTYPDQRVSYKTKTTDKDWYISTIDYIINRAISLNNKSAVRDNINASNGIINAETYKYVSKKYGTDEVPLPGDIRELDLITPIKERYMGEYIRQHSNYQVFNNDFDSISLRNKQLAVKVQSMLAQALINFLNQEINTGVPTKEVPDIKAFTKEFISNWMDERALKATNKIKLIESLTESTILYIQGFYYWWTTEHVISYRTIINNDIHKEIVSPLEYYRVPGDSMFIEDDPMGMRFRYVTINTIIDLHRDKLSDVDKDYLDKLYKLVSTNPVPGAVTVPIELIEGRREFTRLVESNLIQGFPQNLSFTDNTNRVKEYHTVWKTLTKVGYLVYYNELGEISETVVDEKYKINKEAGDVDIEWDWVEEVWEAWRYGDEISGIYVPPRPISVQREKISNLSVCKLSYNGLTGLLFNNDINPIPKRLAPLVALYRIYTLQQERFIAKYKGDILPVPESIMSDSDNFTRIERLNYILSDNYLFYDDTKVDPQILAYLRSVGNGAGIERYISALSELRKDIKREAFELANMNEQRFGDITPHAGKSTTEYAITKATTGSILMFEMYNKFKERDYKADLDYANVAWINGKVGSYYDKNTNKIVYVNIEPNEIYSDNIGIYFENSTLEEERLQQLRNLAFSAAQNGDFDIAAEAVNSDSSVYITSIIKKEMKARRELLNEIERAKREAEIQTSKIEAQKDKEKSNMAYELELMKKDKDIEIALINADIEMIKIGLTGSIPNEYQEEYQSAMRRISERKLELDKVKTGIAMAKSLK